MGSDAESMIMGQATAPFLSGLATLAAGMLMLLAGLTKRQLTWRPRPVDRPRRRRKPRP